MSRPGVEVSSAAAAPPLGVPTDTSVHFIVGEASRGPVDAPTKITSLDEFVATYGDRVPGVETYDAVDTTFRDGVSTAYFMRAVDGSAKLATADAAAIVAGNTATATSPGAWGGKLKLDVVAAAGRSTKKGGPQRSELLTYDVEPQASSTFSATITLDGAVVASSAVPLATRRDLSNFCQQTDYVRLAGPDNDDPISAGSVTLSGGADGAMPVDDDELPTALALIPAELGPGQLSAPGHTYGAHPALLAHAEACNRYALLDGEPDDDPATLSAGAAVLRGAEQDRYGMLVGPWAVIPGLAPGTQRTVPWSAIQAGIEARNDRAGNPNQAGAGQWGISQYATDLTRTFTADEAEQLLYAGVNTARSVYGTIQAYGFRTLVDPAGPRAEWLEGNWARLNMAIVARAEAIGQGKVFAQLDGRGRTIAAFNGELAGMLVEFLNDGALFTEPGTDDPTTAFQVNTGPSVNTPESMADGRLRAVLAVRMSPHAELVQIQIVKYAITVALAA